VGSGGLLAGLLGNLSLGEVVLLGKLQVLQELGVTALHGHVPQSLRLLHRVPVSLPVLVVSGMILRLRHSI